jgi:hypothetical protein
MYNVLEYLDGTSTFGNSAHWEEKVEAGKGRAMGAEFMVQKTAGKTTGWLSYTLAKSDRQFKTINKGQRFPYKYDRRHSLSLCVNHTFSPRIDVSASWTYNTGSTASMPEGQTVTLAPDGEIREADYISRRNNYRLPASHRLNIGINFNKKTKHGMRTWNIGLYNAYNAMNPAFVYAKRTEGRNGEEDKLVIKKFTLLPCLPSVTYTYKF